MGQYQVRKDHTQGEEKKTVGQKVGLTVKHRRNICKIRGLRSLQAENGSKTSKPGFIKNRLYFLRFKRYALKKKVNTHL